MNIPFNNGPTTKLTGPCASCGKPVTKEVPVHIARRTKDLIHDSYECKRLLSIRKSRERYAREKAKGVRG